MVKNHLTLSDQDREQLKSLISKGKATAKIYRRASALLALDRGATFQSASSSLGVNYQTVSSWCRKYHETGLTFLQDKPRPGRPAVISGLQRAKITSLACSQPPKGYQRWSLRLLADRVVELGYCDQISYKHVGDILKKHSQTSSKS